MIDIIIPSFNRFKTIPNLSNNIKLNTRVSYKVNWVLEKEDYESIQTVSIDTKDFALVGTFRSYANAFNTAFNLTTEPFVFMGSDDIEFTPYWDIKALELFEDPSINVVGINSGSLENPVCNLHFLIRRDYIVRESLVTGCPNLTFYPYHHNFVDTELYWTAKNRGIFAPCEESIVIHHRPTEDNDETYKKNNSNANIDRETYNNRTHLFNGVKAL